MIQCIMMHIIQSKAMNLGYTDALHFKLEHVYVYVFSFTVFPVQLVKLLYKELTHLCVLTLLHLANTPDTRYQMLNWVRSFVIFNVLLSTEYAQEQVDPMNPP